MRYVFAGYVVTKTYNSPDTWLERIKAYTGIQEALAKNNEVISIEQIDHDGEYQKQGVRYYFKKFKQTGLFRNNLHRFIKTLKPDVVIIQSLHYPLQVICLRLLLGKHTRIIIHNHAEKPFTRIKKYLQRLSDKFTDAYLFASHDLGAEWVQTGNLGSASKIHEIMEVSSVFYPIDKVIARQKTGVKGDIIFLWVGRLNENKDPLTVVRAFLKFAADNSSVRLYMIYHTQELLPEIRQLLAQSPQKESIVLIGKVPNSELQYWYNSADIVLSGSHYEGSGTAVCEAMSCGCMPLVTNIASFRMITDNGNCGLLYNPGDEIDLFSALQQIDYIDINEKKKLSFDYFKATLSFEAIAEKIQDVASSL